MDEHFEAVVVGSGFGGAVMTYRLAEAGKNVCLLERGRAFGPGDFARRPHELSGNFWRPGAGKHGLFDLWSFAHTEAVVSSGLGGGSLIYANVLLRKDAAWFEERGDGGKRWPISRADLDPHYDAVERMLRPEIYPKEYQVDNKTSAMKLAALSLGYDSTTYDRVDPRKKAWFLPPLAIRFRDSMGNARPGRALDDDGPNYHGKPRETCRLCGECDVGCNYGSKNTLDHTYISAAWSRGAEIRTLVEVESVEPIRRLGRGAYRIVYTRHVPDEHGSRKKQRGEMTAGRVVLAAGTFGTALILMRSRAGLPRLSKRLGERFSGNGDYLSFARNCTRRVDGRSAPRPLDASRAPVITSTFRLPDELDGAPGYGRGGYIQDAGYPLLGDFIWELMTPASIALRLIRLVVERIAGRFRSTPTTEIGNQLGAALGKGTASRTTMPLLGLGREVANGKLTLTRKRRLELSWEDTPSRTYYARIDREARRVAEAMGGRYAQNPFTRYFNRMITVHPLGGCAMAADEREGVVDVWGEVFNYPHLYIADGSVLPGPSGVNPSFTIAALADRFATRMLDTWK